MALMDNLTSGFNDAEEAANQATDTIRDAAEKAVSDAGEAVNQVTTITFGDAAPEVDDTNYQNFEVKKAQDKGIIQLGLVAVVIAGTVGAYVWGKN